MFYLIGLGLDLESHGEDVKEIVSQADKVYLENYTVEFPYDIKKLENQLGREIVPAGREFVETFKVLEGAGDKDTVLLVYGSPLTATTHISLIQEAKEKNIDYKVIYNASILDAVAETGLQLYKFGKIASMPGFEADSYVDIVKENFSINAHTLILVDIGMSFKDALEKLEKDLQNKDQEVGKILICSRLGAEKSQIFYDDLDSLRGKVIAEPFCFIIPGRLHFLEEEFLEQL
ncbi:MAG: diphthine synthase [Nanoarchaeota archaeon]|nr:diphthine synthase [Nanoarchaeota archaeon]